jgi:hypothetical protein
VQPTLLLEDAPQAALGPVRTGPELERLAEDWQGLFQPALVPENVTEIVVGLEIIAFQIDRLAVGCRSLLPPILLPEGDAQVVVLVGILRTEGQRRAEEPKRFLGLRRLCVDQEVRQGVIEPQVAGVATLAFTQQR